MKKKSRITIFTIFILSFLSLKGVSQYSILSDVLYFSTNQTKTPDWKNVKIGFSREMVFMGSNQAKLKINRIRQNAIYEERQSEIDTDSPIPFDAFDQSATDHYLNLIKSKAEFDFTNETIKGKLPPLWYAKLPKMNKIKEFSGLFLDVKGVSWIDTLSDKNKIFINKYKKIGENLFELNGYAIDKSKLNNTELIVPIPEEAVTAEIIQKLQEYKALVNIDSNNFIRTMSGEINVQESISAFGKNGDRHYKDFFYVVNEKK